MSFSIKADTYTLKTKNESNKTILDEKRKYIIPVYQRAYSWREEQVSKFMSDIITAYSGSRLSHDQMFIGTMQIQPHKCSSIVDVIDGQQRLTTFLVLIKVLKLEHKNNEKLNGIKLDWIETKVNGGKQQEILDVFLKLEEIPPSAEEDYSTYIKNAITIKNILDDDNYEYEINDFLNHVLSNIFFVVIETNAGLSETLKIFDTINTTGLDLAAGDIFKIRMYEYLKHKESNSDENKIFSEINEIYGLIDENNKKRGNVSDINGILKIYKYILITRHNLSNELHNLAPETFYERLFETIFNINQWEHFKNNINIDNVNLSLTEIKKLVNIRYKWEQSWQDGDYGTVENAALLKLWHQSRYAKFWDLIFVFLFKYEDDDNKYEKLYEFTRQIVKVYLFYSVYYKKSKNNIKIAFTKSVVDALMKGDYDELMAAIQSKMTRIESGTEKENIRKFEEVISGDIFSTLKRRNLLCRIDALLEEKHTSSSDEDIKDVRNKLFGDIDIDIEHIEPRNHKDGKTKREEIWKKWGDSLNSIGNLMVLERDINRSIGNGLYSEKRKSQKTRKGYDKSCFNIVKKLSSEYEEWNLEMCNRRKEDAVNRIMKFIFPTRSAGIAESEYNAVTNHAKKPETA